MAYLPHVVILIPPTKFRDEELFTTKKVLEDAGVVVEVVSTTTQEVTGMLGGKIKPERLINDVECRDCDALIIIGGVGTVSLFQNEMILEIVGLAAKYEKILAAICVAPSILANTRVLEGKKATAFPSEKANLEEGGARYVDKGVVRDGKIITAQGPEYAEEFAQTIIKTLKEEYPGCCVL